MRGEQAPAWKGEFGRSPVTTTEAAATSRASGYRHRTTAGLMGDAPLQVKRGRKRRARSTVKKAAPIQKPLVALRAQKDKVQASCRRVLEPVEAAVCLQEMTARGGQLDAVPRCLRASSGFGKPEISEAFRNTGKRRGSPLHVSIRRRAGSSHSAQPASSSSGGVSARDCCAFRPSAS